MCGIFSYLSDKNIDNIKLNNLFKNSSKLNPRGPDNSNSYINNNQFLSFYRLAINDLSEKGNQPLIYSLGGVKAAEYPYSDKSDNIQKQDNCILICNGEIYNWKKLKSEYKYKFNSSSDCEIILHLYKQFGFQKTIEKLDGVFSCVLIDKDVMYVARDPIGVRPLFIGNKGNDIMFSSEMKAIHELADNIEQFPPGTIWNSKEKIFIKYYDPDIIYNKNHNDNEITVLQNISDLFINAVDKRLMSDRPIGCMLSGGLDSSLVAAILSSKIKNLQTFSVGLEGATDLEYAKKVADHIGSNHTEIIVTEKEMIDAIPNVIQQIESYDTTTVRASTPMYLLSKYVKENTDITVIYSGEGSDEASGSYLYFKNSPDEKQFHNETVRLMKDLCYFDVLRCDRTTAGHSLEVRVPFLDKDFLNYYMNIKSSLKMCNNKIEKSLLRKAFNKCNLLPDEILWRTKEAMSDGVSSEKNSWYKIIQNHISEKYTVEYLDKLKNNFVFNKPIINESIYYRHLFETFYPGRESLIPYFWLPKWSGNINEPSARVL